MASLTRKLGSPFWYLSFRKDGRWLKKSLGLRTDDATDTGKAEMARAQAEIKELAVMQLTASEKQASAWAHWVPKFLERHCETPQTLKRYLGHWKFISQWLRLRGLHTPAHVTYRSVLDYMEWRQQPKRTGKAAKWNTARNDLKVLSLALTQAARIGFIAANPIAKLGLKKEAAVKKPKLDDEAVQRISAALADEPEWMRVAFQIALHTGCRLRETAMPLTSIDLDAGGGVGKMTFLPKGGEKRTFSRPVPTELRPMFEQMKVEGRKVTLTLPFQPSRRWQQFLKVHDLPKEWVFHCLRVTYINRLRLARVPREVAMRFVNHASEAVHQEYQREEFEDLLPYANAVTFPSAGGGKSPNPTRTPSPKKLGSHPSGKGRARRGN